MKNSYKNFSEKKNLLEEFDSEPVYNGKYLKTKIKSYNGKVNTSFDNSKIPKEGSQCIYVSVILTYSVYRKDKNYHPQVFLEECKYVIKQKRTSQFTIGDIEISSDISYIEVSDEENSNEED